MEKELKYLEGAVNNPVRPMACIVGGAKVSSKVRRVRSSLSPMRRFPISIKAESAPGSPP